MTERSLFLVGNCQVRAIADALRMIFPSWTIVDIASWDFSDMEKTLGAIDYLRTFDVQVRMPLEHSPMQLEEIRPLEHQRVLEIPTLTFPAFHPDMVYALGADGQLFRGDTDFHSAIGLWAWMRGLDAEEAAQLFSDDVCAELGYDEYWQASVEMLHEDYDRSDLDFGRVWPHLHRTGLFMHTINHPKPCAIAVVAKAIALELGADESVWEFPLERYLDDYCATAVWPVYPLVGQRLGLQGTWHWRLHARQFFSPAEWLSAAFASYDSVDPSTINCPRLADGHYDEVLGPKLDRIRKVVA